MKILTKKQRLEIYLKAARIFATQKNFDTKISNMDNGRMGMCSVFVYVIKCGLLYQYPELQMFNPSTTYWLPYNDEGDECRETILLLCAEMCKP